MTLSEAYNIDCIEYMRSLPDNHFDLAVCDPPYGRGNDESLSRGGEDEIRATFPAILPADGTGLREHAENDITAPLSTRRFNGGTWAERHKIGGGQNLQAPQWDIAPPQEFFDELFRVSRNQIIWGGNYFTLPPTRCFLVWKKHIPETFSMAMCEYAWTSFTGNAKVFEYTSHRNVRSGKFHPTEKPQALYGWIYRNFLKDGETVFDPMMGSQASRIAAYKMGIDYTGCEIDRYYYEKGCEFFDRECHGITKMKDERTVIEQSLFQQE